MSADAYSPPHYDLNTSIVCSYCGSPEIGDVSKVVQSHYVHHYPTENSPSSLFASQPWSCSEGGVYEAGELRTTSAKDTPSLTGELVAGGWMFMWTGVGIVLLWKQPPLAPPWEHRWVLSWGLERTLLRNLIARDRRKSPLGSLVASFNLINILKGAIF